MSIRLDERVVKTTPAPIKGAVSIWDDEITGFGLRVFAPTRRNPTEARSFFINYRASGVERRHTIGSFPDWSAKAARDEAKGLRKRIDRGEDPASDRREAPTVKDLAERYKATHLPRKAEQSQKNDWAMIVAEILPALGARKVADVHHGDIVSIHNKVSERGAPVRANRVLAVASKMLSLAATDGGRGRAMAGRGAGQPLPGRRAQPGRGQGAVFLDCGDRRADRRSIYRTTARLRPRIASGS